MKMYACIHTFIVDIFSYKEKLSRKYSNNLPRIIDLYFLMKYTHLKWITNTSTKLNDW